MNISESSYLTKLYFRLDEKKTLECVRSFPRRFSTEPRKIFITNFREWNIMIHVRNSERKMILWWQFDDYLWPTWLWSTQIQSIYWRFLWKHRRNRVGCIKTRKRTLKLSLWSLLLLDDMLSYLLSIRSNDISRFRYRVF